MQLFAALEERLARADFEACLSERLKAARHSGQRGDASDGGGGAGGKDASGGVEGGDADVEDASLGADWWELDGQGTLRAVSEATGPYLVVEHADAVEALAQFIAAYIVTLPEAANLDSRDLQRALVGTVAELRRGRVRRLLDWARHIYRAAALTAGVFSAYTNPWLARALLTAVWTALRTLRVFAL